ncbi:transposase [Streptomyces niveiscabiei]|uniref:Transposase n=1 Tax=Streptomyces niveiscabiei TaxID=164115 RepID=A0ABW9HVJ8_9ACTN
MPHRAGTPSTTGACTCPAWASDRERRREAGIPEEVAFATKPQLGREMLAAALASKTPFTWLVADADYGKDLALRAETAGQGQIRLRVRLLPRPRHRRHAAGRVHRPGRRPLVDRRGQRTGQTAHRARPVPGPQVDPLAPARHHRDARPGLPDHPARPAPRPRRRLPPSAAPLASTPPDPGHREPLRLPTRPPARPTQTLAPKRKLPITKSWPEVVVQVSIRCRISLREVCG